VAKLFKKVLFPQFGVPKVLFPQFGVPKVLISDNGTHFIQKNLKL